MPEQCRAENGTIRACNPLRLRLLKKGTPASAANRHRGWHGAVNAPVHGCFRETLFYDPDPCHWAGVMYISPPIVKKKV